MPGGNGGGTNTPISRNLETNNQTLPRTFRWNSNNHATPTPTLIAAAGSQSQLPSEKSTINRFLNGSGTNTPMSSTTISRNLEINSSPMPWKSSSINFCDSPYQRRRLDNSVESAAKFLTEALPCTNNTGSCKNSLFIRIFSTYLFSIEHNIFFQVTSNFIWTCESSF